MSFVSSNPSQVELGVHNTSVLSCTWTNDMIKSPSVDRTMIWACAISNSSIQGYSMESTERSLKELDLLAIA